MIPEVFVVFRKGVNPDLLDELNQQTVDIDEDEKWEEKKMDGKLPLIEEWKINHLLISNLM